MNILIFGKNVQFRSFLKIALSEIGLLDLKISEFETEKAMEIFGDKLENFDLLLVCFEVFGRQAVSFFTPEFGEGMMLFKPFNAEDLKNSINKIPIKTAC